MRLGHSLSYLFCAVMLSAGTNAGLSQTASVMESRQQAQRQVLDYLNRLADIHCTEEVVQEKLGKTGHPEAAQHSKYDYLVMIKGNRDDFQMNESRVEASTTSHKTPPLLVTNGFSTLLLVFHPYYQNSYEFEAGGREVLDGKAVFTLRFKHIPGTRSPVALAVRGREYAIDLQGTVWLDAQSGEVVKIEASLQHDMADIGLRSMKVAVQYASVALNKNADRLSLPSLAVIELETPRQRWRNTHRFTDYKLFSTEAEQDPNVKIRADAPAVDSDQAVPKLNTPKERP